MMVRMKITPNVMYLPGGTMVGTPGVRRFSSMNVPLVLPKSVTNSEPSFF